MLHSFHSGTFYVPAPNELVKFERIKFDLSHSGYLRYSVRIASFEPVELREAMTHDEMVASESKPYIAQWYRGKPYVTAYRTYACLFFPKEFEALLVRLQTGLAPPYVNEGERPPVFQDEHFVFEGCNLSS